MAWLVISSWVVSVLCAQMSAQRTGTRESDVMGRNHISQNRDVTREATGRVDELDDVKYYDSETDNEFLGERDKRVPDRYCPGIFRQSSSRQTCWVLIYKRLICNQFCMKPGEYLVKEEGTKGKVGNIHSWMSSVFMLPQITSICL